MNTEQAKRLNALLKRAKKLVSSDDSSHREPSMQIVTAFLEWEATTEIAEQAIGRLFTELVDINELRVTPDTQLIEIIGENYPNVQQRIVRMRQTLNEVFAREHSLEMASIQSQGKKEQRAYLETLPGIAPYVLSKVALVNFGIHAMPVDRALMALLKQEEIIDDTLQDELAVEGMLLRQIKADEALNAHLSLRALADEQGPKRIARNAPRTKPAAVKPKKKK